MPASPGMPVQAALFRRPGATFAAFLVLHVAAWTLLPMLVNGNLPLDVIEHLAWGREWQWGYHKHPPLVAWLPELAGVLAGGNDWGLYLLSQLCVAAAFWSMWRLAREFVTPGEALLSVLLLEAVAYHNFTSPEFNVNVALLGFWALTILCFWWALSRRSIAAWVATGIVAACAVLSKYLAAFILVPLLLYLLVDREARQALRGPGPYLALACFMALIAPHLVWVWQNDFITLGYGLQRTGIDEARDWSRHLVNPLRFVLAQAAHLVLPVLLLFSLGRPVRQSRTTPAARRYLHFVALGPLLLYVAVSAATGMRLRSMWGTPLLAIAGLYLVYFFAPARATWRMPRFVAAWTVTALLFVAAYAGSALFADGKRTDYPGAEIARQLEMEWSNRFATPLRYVIGDEWFAGNVGWYGASRPSVYLGGDPLQAPWVDDAAVRRAGALVVWDIRHPDKFDLDRLRTRFGPFDEQPPLATGWRAGKGGAAVSIGWALIPPADGGS